MIFFSALVNSFFKKLKLDSDKFCRIGQTHESEVEWTSFQEKPKTTQTRVVLLNAWIWVYLFHIWIGLVRISFDCCIFVLTSSSPHCHLTIILSLFWVSLPRLAPPCLTVTFYLHFWVDTLVLDDDMNYG